MTAKRKKAGRPSAPPIPSDDAWRGMTLRDVVEFADRFGCSVTIALTPIKEKKVRHGK